MDAIDKTPLVIYATVTESVFAPNSTSRSERDRMGIRVKVLRVLKGATQAKVLTLGSSDSCDRIHASIEGDALVVGSSWILPLAGETEFSRAVPHIGPADAGWPTFDFTVDSCGPGWFPVVDGKVRAEQGQLGSGLGAVSVDELAKRILARLKPATQR